jgi:hypothetical protein
MSKESIKIISDWTPEMFGANLWQAAEIAHDHFTVKPRWWLRLLLRGLSRRPNAGVEGSEDSIAKGVPAVEYFTDNTHRVSGQEER